MQKQVASLMLCTWGAGRQMPLLGVVETQPQPQPLCTSLSTQQSKPAKITNPRSIGCLRCPGRCVGRERAGMCITSSSVSGPEGRPWLSPLLLFAEFFSLCFLTWKQRGLEGRGGA